MLNLIQNAKPEEMNDILMAVQQRFQELFPDWELITISVQKAVDKNAQLDQIIKLLQQMKEV